MSHANLGLPQVNWLIEGFYNEMIILPTTSSPPPPPPAPAPVLSTTIIIKNIIIDVCFFVFFFFFFYFFPERRTAAFQLPSASNFLESNKQHFLRWTFVPDLRIHVRCIPDTLVGAATVSVASYSWRDRVGSTLEISRGGGDTSFERHDFAGS